MNENRIVNYDGKSVTFCYNAHEDSAYHEKIVSAVDFIKLIIKHLVPEQFKIIGYYGFYRKKHKLHNKLKLLIDTEKKY